MENDSLDLRRHIRAIKQGKWWFLGSLLFFITLAIVYNISPKYFLGLTGVANNTLFESRSRSIRQSKWQAKLFLGIRL